MPARRPVATAAITPEAGPDITMSGDMIIPLGAMVRGAIQNALAEIDPNHSSTSATASVVQLVGQQLVVGQLGHSRVYIARDGHVSRLTQPAPAPPEHAVVGPREHAMVDILVVTVQPGDRLLLCSDGLHASLDSDAILTELFQIDLRAAAPAAIRHAHACGGADNITALFVEFIADEIKVAPGESKPIDGTSEQIP